MAKTSDEEFEAIRAKVAAYPAFDPDKAIDAAVAAERERCAAVCDEIARRYMVSNLWTSMSTAQECAAAIRKGE